MILSENWAQAMLPTLREIYRLGADKEKDYIAAICGRKSSKLQRETTLGIGARGLMKKWNDVGRTTPYADTEKGHETTYIHEKYVDGASIDRDWVEDNQYDKIEREVRNLRREGHNTQQHHFASMFNNAFSAIAGYTLADGKPLASATHTYNAAGTGGAFSNYAALALNSDNLETVRTAVVTGWKDDQGNLLNTDAGDLMLLVPTALRKTALVIADSDGEPDIADNNVNVWKGSIDVMECPRLTDTTSWFVIVKNAARDLCHWYDRRPLGFSSTVHFDTEAALYRIIGRWSYGSDCPPAWVYCCRP
uniref:Putative capsid protein n=1 Tax=viral metagenome TaxID=1070528 RepID=A0A6M3IEP6_9ZZZZ